MDADNTLVDRLSELARAEEDAGRLENAGILWLVCATICGEMQREFLLQTRAYAEFNRAALTAAKRLN